MNQSERIRHMSTKELALFGMQDIAYVKHAVGDGEPGYAVHAADGTQIAFFTSREAAIANAMTHELETVSGH